MRFIYVYELMYIDFYTVQYLQNERNEKYMSLDIKALSISFTNCKGNTVL